MSSTSDQDLRDLERRWQESGAEPDRHGWLCERLRRGWADELAEPIRGLEEAIHAGIESQDVEVSLKFGFETGEPEDPLARLRAFSRKAGWWPVAPEEVAERTQEALDVRGMVGLYPHDPKELETAAVARDFGHLFRGALVFANFRYLPGGGSTSARHRGTPEDWEYSVNRVIGAVLGPFCGYISVNARESL